ncbi:hypothetical protein IWQ60_009325 [Tieghemiomyces parasiticus]|uniref:Uncharacterized protein n=1 Tax=Tieghemiomyces parasiticus TaxID=78921 RepID=A0A9W7ZV36_9FUNG|nr:hypothetical protein IWQ60_009325 [Tieghemiomyces parasiticus]
MSYSVEACQKALTSATRDLYYISECDSAFDYFFIPADELISCNASTVELPRTAAGFASVMYNHEDHTNLRHVLIRCANADRVQICNPPSDDELLSETGDHNSSANSNAGSGNVSSDNENAEGQSCDGSSCPNGDSECGSGCKSCKRCCRPTEKVKGLHSDAPLDRNERPPRSEREAERCQENTQRSAGRSSDTGRQALCASSSCSSSSGAGDYPGRSVRNSGDEVKNKPIHHGSDRGSPSSSDDSLYESTPFKSRVQSLDDFFKPLLVEESSMGQHRQFKELKDRLYLMFTADLGPSPPQNSDPLTPPPAHVQRQADIMSKCCVYRIGQREVGIYVAGIIPHVGIAGLKTLAVET